jgi:hypothetical protein
MTVSSSVEPALNRHGEGCVCRACGHEASLTAADDYQLEEPGRADPTSTTTVQRELSRWLRGRLGELNAEVRRLVKDEDALNLRNGQLSRWGNLSPDERARRLDEFVAERGDRILKKIERGEVDPFIEQAARRGVKDATADLRKHNLDVADPEDTFQDSSVQEDIALARERLRGEVAGDLATYRSEVRRLATSGMAAGISVSVLVEDITERASVAKSRVTADAAGEIVNTYSTTQLTSYETVSDEVKPVLTTEVEWITAGDDRVCEECQALSDQDWTLERARSEDPIPVHQYCRCRWRVTDVIDADL